MDFLKLLGISRPPIGDGLAAQAAQIIQSRPYQMHLQEAQALGQAPLSPQDFLKQQMQAQAPQGLLNQ